MRVIVCGDRNYRDRATVFRVLDRLHAERGIDFLIQGAADGTDYLAWQWADERDVPCGSYAADWDDIDHPDAVIRHRKGKPYNANAGSIRNQRMIDKGKPDGMVAFPGGPGTARKRRSKPAVDGTERAEPFGLDPARHPSETNSAGILDFCDA